MVAINRCFPENNRAGKPTGPKPSEDVLDWCRTLVAMIADGGVWGIPRSGVMFKFDKAAKRMTLTMGKADDPDVIATKEVFSHIGWTVVTGE